MQYFFTKKMIENVGFFTFSIIFLLFSLFPKIHTKFTIQDFYFYKLVCYIIFQYYNNTDIVIFYDLQGLREAFAPLYPVTFQLLPFSQSDHSCIHTFLSYFPHLRCKSDYHLCMRLHPRFL